MAKMTLDEFVNQMKAALGADLRAVAVYGSAAAGEHHAGKSDTNLLVVVDSLSAERLRAASATVSAWTEGGNTAPLLLTSDEWRGSGDIFAMEFADILERHRLLFGGFPSDVKVDPVHLRHELEREAMVAVLQLRRAALATGSDGKALVSLLVGGGSTIMALFRAVVRLRGEAPSKDDVDVDLDHPRGDPASAWQRADQAGGCCGSRGRLPRRLAPAGAVS